MLYGKGTPRYVLKYPDRTFVLGTLSEAKKLLKQRKGGRTYKITLSRR